MAASPSPRDIACFALLVSIIALQVPSSCIDQRQRGTSTSTTAGATPTSGAAPSAPPAHPPLSDDGALQAMLPLAVMEAQLIAAAILYGHHLHHAAANWRISELVFFGSCLQVGFLQFFLFVQHPAAGGAAAADDAQGRALGIVAAAAAHALPGFASVAFFLGIILIYVHVGNGGGGAGGAVAAGDGQVPPAPAGGVGLLGSMTLGAALACLTSIILASFWINTNK